MSGLPRSLHSFPTRRSSDLYVRVAAPDGSVREYVTKDASAGSLEGRPRRRMGCIDCHNRPAHTFASAPERAVDAALGRSEEHTSELQSRLHLVCRLLLEKKK